MPTLAEIAPCDREKRTSPRGWLADDNTKKQRAGYVARKSGRHGAREAYARFLEHRKSTNLLRIVSRELAANRSEERKKYLTLRFHHLAIQWENDTRHVSSIHDMTSHPAYQKIIGLGWDIVPQLLMDLQANKRFWFPALYEITKVRPF